MGDLNLIEKMDDLKPGIHILMISLPKAASHKIQETRTSTLQNATA
jgi:hypothetical protein